MIERQIINQKAKEKEIQEYIYKELGRISCSKIKMMHTPLGEKIVVYTSKPGLIVGRKGANIKLLTTTLKNQFKMENPQIEVAEIENPYLDAASVARDIISSIERFGPKRFKAVAYQTLERAMRAGATGIEIVIGGRGVPGERAKTWRFMSGYLKKSGDISANYIDRANEQCNLRSGTIGIKVSILHPETKLPDRMELRKPVEIKEEAKEKKPARERKKKEEIKNEKK